MPMMSSASGLRAAVPCRCLSMSDIPVYRLVDRIFMENIAEIERCEEQLREALLNSDVGLLDSLLGDDLIFTNQRSEEHTSELQSLMRISYAVFCLKKKNNKDRTNTNQ